MGALEPSSLTTRWLLLTTPYALLCCGGGRLAALPRGQRVHGGDLRGDAVGVAHGGDQEHATVRQPREESAGVCTTKINK
eukprot:8426049-Pyramimonas_sp.AAC.1